MPTILDLPPDLFHLTPAFEQFLARVSARFDEQLASDLPPVSALVRHVERYRGKMLRPMLVMLCGQAAHAANASPASSAAAPAATNTLALSSGHAIAGAVCEMVHMATLVHDDVLDEADVRRKGQTVNRLHGNEAAVILGDYLIASAYHLCSRLEPAEIAQRAALAVGRASMIMCAGELLQLHHRDDFSLDEPTYFEIVSRKTGELIATACELGAMLSGARDPAPYADFGRKLGIAFQIQDDLLDLTGAEDVVGKSVGKDLEKGKMTLPLIHHLAGLDGKARARSLLLVEAAGNADLTPDERHHAAIELRRALDQTGSIAWAGTQAGRLVSEATRGLLPLLPPATPIARVLAALADAVTNRKF